MAFIQEFFTSRNNKVSSVDYKGQRDRLWYDPVTNTIRVSDGITLGGIIVGGGSGTYGNANVAAYLPTDPTILAVNASIVTANLGMKAYVDAQVISAGGYNDAAVAVFLPTYTGNLANSSDIIALYANAAAQHQSLLAVNNAIVVANNAVVSYVNTITLDLAANIDAANAAIVTANSAVVSYVNNLNLAMLANVDAANAAIVTANSAVVSYVNTITLDLAANIDAANAAIVTANTAMKSYVDYQISQGGGSYGNTQVAAYLPTYTGSLANSSDIIALNLLKANISSPTFTGNVIFDSNTAISLPAGNSLQRPIGTAGQIRYNTDTDVFEGYSTGWYEISSNVQLSANLQGGSNNQILVKKSSSDYDYAWEDMIINLPENTYTKLLDQASTTVLYLGEAAPNSLEASAVWRIQKILFDATGNVEEVRFAAGGNFNQIWNNRASLSYV